MRSPGQHLRSRLVRLARAVATATVVAGALVVAAPALPAHADSITLYTSDSDPYAGEWITVTATWDDSAGVLHLREGSTGILCTDASVPCQIERGKYSAGTYQFHAELKTHWNGTLIEEKVLAITWREPERTCEDVPSPAEVCVTVGRESQRVVVYDGEPFGAPEVVAGYVDQYRFSALATVTIPCVTLVYDGTEANPCETAGGTFVSRVATLWDAEAYEGPDTPEPLANAAVCHASLTVLVGGFGVNSLPMYHLC